MNAFLIAIGLLMSGAGSPPSQSDYHGYGIAIPSNPDRPFRFLRGSPRLPWHAGARDIERRYVGFYSFRADYEDVKRAAKAELIPLGYKFDGHKSGCYFMNGPRNNPTPMVVINKD